MEPNQVHRVAAAVSCDAQQIIYVLEPRFTGQIVRDVGDGNRHNRIHDDVPLVHPVTTTHLYMGTCPDANAASDSPAPDSLAKAFGEHHMELHQPIKFNAGIAGNAEQILFGFSAPAYARELHTSYGEASPKLAQRPDAKRRRVLGVQSRTCNSQRA
jgi:hypothetical protein